MKINANDYKPNEIMRFLRQASNLTQEQFAKKIGKSKDWQQSNELGRTNYLFKDLLEIAKIYNFEIIIKQKDNRN